MRGFGAVEAGLKLVNFVVQLPPVVLGDVFVGLLGFFETCNHFDDLWLHVFNGSACARLHGFELKIGLHAVAVDVGEGLVLFARNPHVFGHGGGEQTQVAMNGFFEAVNSLLVMAASERIDFSELAVQG